MLSHIRILPRLLIGFGVLVLMIAALGGFSVLSSWSAYDLLQDGARLKDNEILDQRATKRVFEGRMHVWMALATGDATHWQQASVAFQTAHERMHDLIALRVRLLHQKDYHLLHLECHRPFHHHLKEGFLLYKLASLAL